MATENPIVMVAEFHEKGIINVKINASSRQQEEEGLRLFRFLRPEFGVMTHKLGRRCRPGRRVV
jgi:hypothetical protein